MIGKHASDVYAVRCPRCHAEPGFRCISANSGNARTNKPHAMRVDAAQDAAPRVVHCGRKDSHTLHTWFDGDSGGVMRRCTGREVDRNKAATPLPHIPQRGSDIETWLKAKRDEFRDGDAYARGAYTLIDHLLDEYRLRADCGLRMGDDLPEGGG